MIRDQQIDKISELFLDLAKGLFLAAFGVQFFTGSDIILFWKYILGAISCATFAIGIISVKGDRK